MNGDCKSLFNIIYKEFISRTKDYKSFDDKYNIFDQNNGFKYLIEDENYKIFYDLYNECFNRKVCTHLAEVQKNTISCLDIDLDILQSTEINEFTYNDEEYIIKQILSVIDNYCYINESFYISISTKSKIIKKNNDYKNGFHIKILLKFTPNEKLFILKQIKEANIFDYFKTTKNIISSNFIDLQSLHASVLLHGSNKNTLHNEQLYELSSILFVEKNNDTFIFTSEDLSKFTNIPLELSILFPGNIINNKYKIQFIVDVTEIDTQYNSDNIVENFNDDVEYVKHLIFNVFKPFRYENRECWKNIITYLANIDNINIDVAVDFSKQWSNYNERAYDDLKSIWNWGKDHKNKYAIKNIEKYANEDNTRLFLEAYNKRYKLKIFDVLSKTCGILTENDAALLIYEQYCNKIIYQDKYWYTYNNRSNCWDKEDICPPYFYKFVTEYLKDQMEKTILYFEKVKTKDEEKFMKNLYYSKNNCSKIAFCTNIEKHLERQLRRYPNVVFDSEEHSHIIGLENGIFNLKTFSFVTNPEDYYITRRTKASLLNIPDINNWPNPNNGNYDVIIKILRVLRDIISDEETLTFVMCYLSSSLSYIIKPPLFFIWYGNGRNGKSTIDELTQKTLGSVTDRGYSFKMPSSFYCDSKDTLGPESAKMQLQHARYVGSGEINAGAKLHMARIKEITSDTISGNEKYEKQKTFRPRCVFVLSTNAKPHIVPMDYAAQRRLRFCWFKNTFVDYEPETKYEKKNDATLYHNLPMKKEYLDGYLEILIYYYSIYSLKYNEDIESIPHSLVKEESRRFYLEQDNLSAFIDYTIIFNEESNITLSEFCLKYKGWYSAYIDTCKFSKNDIKDELFKTKLKNYIKTGNELISMNGNINIHRGETYILKHRFIEDNERNELKNPVFHDNEEIEILSNLLDNTNITLLLNSESVNNNIIIDDVD